MELFEIENKVVKLTPDCLLIPELKAISENYKDPIQVYTYLHYVTSPRSPYRNLEEDIIDEEVHKDYPGDYSPNDYHVANAKAKLKKLTANTVEKYFVSMKHGMEKMSHYMEQVIISDDRVLGNITYVQKALDNAGKTIESFKKLEKEREEVLNKSRGKKLEAWDLED